MHEMYAVIRNNRDGSVSTLQTCKSREAAIIASQMEKEKAPLSERGRITAVVLDDGGYLDIRF